MPEMTEPLIEIICSKGTGTGTTVKFNGEEITGINHLTLEIPAGDRAVLTIKRYLMVNGKIQLLQINDKSVLGTETLRFVGRLEPE